MLVIRAILAGLFKDLDLEFAPYKIDLVLQGQLGKQKRDIQQTNQIGQIVIAVEAPARAVDRRSTKLQVRTNESGVRPQRDEKLKEECVSERDGLSKEVKRPDPVHSADTRIHRTAPVHTVI